MTLILAISIIFFLAYANGANDNFKGVATLLGSGSATFSGARIWATVTTGLGSIAALLLAHGLLAKFSGKGLVPDDLIALKSFSLSVALAAAGTVMLATRFGFPISTTHALTGALVGAGWMGTAAGVNFAKLGSSFFLPLLVSPMLAVTLAAVVYPLMRFSRRTLKVEKETCLCVGNEVIAVVGAGMSAQRAVAQFAPAGGLPTFTIGTTAICVEKYRGEVLGISALSLVDSVHYLSSGVVGFARGLNDTPKIAALLLVANAFSPAASLTVVALAMALGGWFGGAKVAHTMAHKVTEMNAGQGFTANLVTGVIVIAASRFGLPVSTTHVSCGSLFGIGAVTGRAKWKTVFGILLAWVTTLPVAAALGTLFFSALNGRV